MTNLEKATKVKDFYNSMYPEKVEVQVSFSDNDVKSVVLIVNNVMRFYMARFEKDDAMGIAHKIHQIYNELHKEQEEVERIGKELADFEFAKEKLFVKLLNTEKNQKRLEGIVTKPWHNLSMILCIYMEVSDRGGCIQVPEKILDKWGIGKDEIFDIALKNAEKKFPAKPRPMHDALMGIMDMDVTGEDAEIFTSEESIYLCRSDKTPTAAGFLYPSTLRLLNPGDFVIPSSTEECIILRGIGEYNDKLKGIVLEVNKTEVSEDVFLADNIYECVGNGEFICH